MKTAYRSALLMLVVVAMLALGPFGRVALGADGQMALPSKLVVPTFNWGWGMPDPEKDKVGPVLAERLGFKLEIPNIIISGPDELMNRLQTWAASGMTDWPNFLYLPPGASTLDLTRTLGEAGQLLDWRPILEQYPVVKAHVEPSLPVVSVPETGAVYLLPAQTPGLRSFKNVPYMLIRKDWLDQLGLDYPETFDEFYEVLVAFKEQIGTVDGQPVIPYIPFPEDGFEWSLEYFWPPYQYQWYHDENGELQYGKFHNLKSIELMALFYNRLYREGLIPRDVFSLKVGQIEELAAAGRVGVMLRPDWIMSQTNDSFAETRPGAMFVGAPPLYEPQVSDGVAPWLMQPTIWIGVTVKASTPPEEIHALMKAFEFNLSEEGVKLMFFGVEGVHWQLNEDGLVEDTPYASEVLQGDWNKRAAEGIDAYSLMTNFDLVNQIAAPQTRDLRPDYQETFKNMGENVYFQGYVTDPAYYVSPGPVEARNFQALSDAWKEMVIRAVLADSPEQVHAIVAAWPATAKSLGYDEVMAEREAAIAKMKR